MRMALLLGVLLFHNTGRGVLKTPHLSFPLKQRRRPRSRSRGCPRRQKLGRQLWGGRGREANVDTVFAWALASGQVLVLQGSSARPKRSRGPRPSSSITGACTRTRSAPIACSHRLLASKLVVVGVASVLTQSWCNCGVAAQNREATGFRGTWRRACSVPGINTHTQRIGIARAS